ncbi:MAG: pilus assembly protein PilP, partial [Syntrophorhabdaceae bacterium]|nr:pilus assembly protein PilP [Syntrophorhabdaceae bacterium]
SAFVAILISLVFLVVVSGCEDEPPPPPPIIKRPAPPPPPAEPPPPVEAEAGEEDKDKDKDKSGSSAADDQAEKRDPFSYSKIEAEGASEEQAPLLPLQRYDLSDLKMVGVIWGGNDPKALIEDAEGTGYTVGIGEKVGRSGGVVVRVTQTEIIVREQFPGAGGKMVTRENSLQLITAGGN